MNKEKTHWLQNPNKNYLGHWDLPNGKDVILTIESAKWEEVKNPVINTSEAKRVVRFIEKHSWLKPFICNEINAQTILKSTGIKFMEDSRGKRIKIGVGTTKVKREEVDCLRVRLTNQKDLEPSKITKEQVEEIQGLLDKTDKSAEDICKAYKIKNLAELNKPSYNKVVKRLEEIKNADN